MASDSQLEKSVFEAARDLTNPAHRSAFLDQACNGDEALRARIERLLSAAARADDFLAGCAPALEAAAAELDPSQIGPLPDLALSANEKLGTSIGPYKLLEKIGEGGCGIVYMAEQNLRVRRRVALKVIKRGMDTKGVIARFEAERQALALMNHPNIARVLDAGATEAGRPYFIMDLVYGSKITDHLDQNELAVDERLKIFIQVCHGIQHAHQKGIIHRDIKPSNILVTKHDGLPVPKIIDFGIAKATQQHLTDKTLFTSYAQFIGTPAYMSPEQMELSGLSLDTRSDIYSLGVLLYELLTGKTPFDTKELLKSGVLEMRRTLREREPSSPSAKLRTLSGEELRKTAMQRQVAPRRLSSHCRGDLDRIVMKCLEKNRDRRYETANALAMDIQRHLNNEPVVARPPNGSYRFQKLVRRNRLVFASGAAVTVVLLLGAITSTGLLVREHEARIRETQMRREAEAREKLTQTVTQASLLVARGKYEDADQLLGNAVLENPSKEVADLLRALGEWHAKNGRWQRAAQLFAALAKVDKFDSWDRVTLDFLEMGPALIQAGDLDGYERFRQMTILRSSGVGGPWADRVVKVTLLQPAGLQLLQDLLPQVEIAQRTFEEMAKRDTWKAAWHAEALGLWEYRRGDYAKAAEWCRRCLAIPQPDKSLNAAVHAILAMACWKMNQYPESFSELGEGQKFIEPKFKEGPSKGTGAVAHWYNWDFARILLQEATRLLRDPPK